MKGIIIMVRARLSIGLFNIFCFGLAGSLLFAAQEKAENPKVPFCFFKAPETKDPYVLKYHPGSNYLQSITCGYWDSEKETFLHTEKMENLENLAVIRATTYLCDIIKKIDHKYDGYREYVIGEFIEEVLKAVKVLQDKSYGGTVLIDEYLQSLPTKFVIKNLTGLKSLQKYYEKQFELKKIAPSANKPVLAIELIDTSQKLECEDLVFWNKYFDVADSSDASVGLMFDSFQKIVDEAYDHAKDAAPICETYGETGMRLAEKYCLDFKVQNIVAAGALLFTFVMAYKLFDRCVLKKVEDKICEAFNGNKSKA
jgi:hypothetical protein